MKNHRFLWLRNRTTNNRKCEKARNIKEKRAIEMFSTDSKQLVVLRSSPNVNRISRKRQFYTIQSVIGRFRTSQDFGLGRFLYIFIRNYGTI